MFSSVIENMWKIFSKRFDICLSTEKWYGLIIEKKKFDNQMLSKVKCLQKVCVNKGKVDCFYFKKKRVYLGTNTSFKTLVTR